MKHSPEYLRRLACLALANNSDQSIRAAVQMCAGMAGISEHQAWIEINRMAGER